MLFMDAAICLRKRLRYIFRWSSKVNKAAKWGDLITICKIWWPCL